MTQNEFEALSIQMRAKPHDVARQMLPSPEDAEDASSEAMLRMWAMHDHIRDNDHALKLATVIARRLSIDIIRKRKMRLTLFADDREGTCQMADRCASPSERMELEEDERWLEQRMEKLPPRELQVLRMRQVEHRSNEEIARLMGIGEKSVSVMLSAARRKLFNEIKERNRQ